MTTLSRNCGKRERRNDQPLPFQRSCRGEAERRRVNALAAAKHSEDVSTFQRFNVLTPQRPNAFTLIELLVVIAIIAILAAILLPVLSAVKTHAYETKAKTEVSDIVNAIEQYDSTYSRMPVATWVQQSGSTNVTYGGTYANSTGATFPPAGYTGLYISSNSDVMAILLDLTNYPNTTVATINTNYQKNPKQITMLSVKYSSDTNSPGVGPDLNYRDPWGNPYIISMDLNDDDKCEDAFYATPGVSSATGAAGGTGLNGLSYQPDGNYAFHGNVMVWSMGPNGPFNHSPSSFTYSTTGNSGSGWAQDASNKHHIMSWVQ